jgi:hypothetical protein
MSDSTVERLASITVQTPDGEPYTLGEAWAKQPVVLALIRHFG